MQSTDLSLDQYWNCDYSLLSTDSYNPFDLPESLPFYTFDDRDNLSDILAQPSGTSECRDIELIENQLVSYPMLVYTLRLLVYMPLTTISRLAYAQKEPISLQRRSSKRSPSLTVVPQWVYHPEDTSDIPQETKRRASVAEYDFMTSDCGSHPRSLTLSPLISTPELSHSASSAASSSDLEDSEDTGDEEYRPSPEPPTRKRRRSSSFTAPSESASSVPTAQ